MELSSIRDLKATINKEGKHGASMEVTADDIEFLSPKAEQVDQQTGYKKVEPDDLPY